MARIKLTAGRVDDFTCTDGTQAFLWDSEAPGLAVRSTQNGAKAYIHQGKLNGKTVRLTLGNIKSWRLNDARDESRKLQTLFDKGIDPRELMRDLILAADEKRAEDKRKVVVFSDVWSIYIEHNKSSWGDRHYKDHINLSAIGGQVRPRSKKLTVDGPLASLHPLLLSELTGNRIAAWISEESSKRPTSTALSYRLLRAFIRWVASRPEYRDLIPSDAYNSTDVRKALPKSKSKDDCLQREQLAGWFDAVRKINNPVISAYLQSLLLTGARREELIGLRWQDIDFKWKTLTIRDKIEGQRTIPLTPYVTTLLLDLKHLSDTPPSDRHIRKMRDRGEQFSPTDWVFYSRTAADGRLAEPRPAHVQALEVADLPHLTIHGLRRSFGTLCEWVEVPTGISAQIMGHKPSAIAEKHYRRRPIDLLRAWHIKIEEWMLAQAGIEQHNLDTSHALLTLVK